MLPTKKHPSTKSKDESTSIDAPPTCSPTRFVSPGKSSDTSLREVCKVPDRQSSPLKNEANQKLRVIMQSSGQELSKTSADVTSNKDSCQEPKVVTWSATSGTDSPSFTFTIQLPPGANQTPGVPLQIVTPPVFLGGSKSTAQSAGDKKSPGQDMQASGSKIDLPPNSTTKREGSTKIQDKIQVPVLKMPAITLKTSTPTKSSQTNSETSISYKDKDTDNTIDISGSSEGRGSSRGADLLDFDDESSNDHSDSGRRSPSIISLEDSSTDHRPRQHTKPIGYVTGPCKRRSGGINMYPYVTAVGEKGEPRKPGPYSTQSVKWIALPSPATSNAQKKPLEMFAVHQDPTEAALQQAQSRKDGEFLDDKCRRFNCNRISYSN